MFRPTLRFTCRLLIALSSLTGMSSFAGAQTGFDLHGLGPSGAQVAGVLVGAGVVIGTGVYFLARQPRLTGCVVDQGGGLTLQDSSTKDPMYRLEGQTSTLRPGEKVKVIGRKHTDHNQQHVIRVSRVAKDYGTCSPLATASVKSPSAP